MTAVSKNKVTVVSIGTVLHFLVDGLCACCLFLMAEGGEIENLVGLFVTYTVMAFLTQPLTGMLADRLRQDEMLLALSVALLASGVAVASLLPSFIIAVLLGLGNSFFHVWGGKKVAVTTGNDIRALGIFVSTGAFGLAIGMLLHSWLLLYAFLLAVVGLAIFSIRQHPVERLSLPATRLKPWMVWCSLLALMAVVMLRSMIGESVLSGMIRDWEGVLTVGFLVMFGKATGGFLAKRIGIVWTMVLVVAGCFVSAYFYLPLPCLLLVNLTMAVTLYLANVVMPGREGLAFGLLAAALIPGFLVATFTGGGLSFMPSLLATLLPTIVIELLVLWSLRERRADVLWSSVMVNILTNVPLNLFVTYVSDSIMVIIVAEVLVVLAEALWYWYFVGRWRKALIYSSLCNGFSLTVGLLAYLVVLLFNTL